jgi:hypothetical protein
VNAFKLNLIKDQVPGFKQRRVIFWQMHLYVLLSGALLVYVSFEAAREASAYRSVMQDSQIIETTFSRKYDEQGGMGPYLQDVSRDVVRKTEWMASVDDLMNQRLLLSPVLAGIARALRSDMSLVRFELKGGGGFEFDIACGKQKGANIDSSVLIAAWESDEKLAEVLKSIKPARVQRQLVGKGSVILLKYEGSIKAGAI